MALTRKQHWATRAYHDFLLSRANQPYLWGSNDCALFAADGILAITGEDIAADFRGKYKTKTSAMATIRAVTGGKTIADAAAYCATKAGLQELTTPWEAQRGDLVLFDQGGNLVAGLIGLNGRHVHAPGDKQLMRIPITKVKRAWRV